MFVSEARVKARNEDQSRPKVGQVAPAATPGTVPNVRAVNTPPLAHLRRGPGRSRKAESGHAPSTSRAMSRVNGVSPNATSASDPPEPRLLNLKAAANYLGVSPWTVRDLEAKRVLKRVTVPLPGGTELRKLLFDKVELDRLIDVWKT